MTTDTRYDIGFSYLLRLVAAGSVALGLFWAVGLVTDVHFGFDISSGTFFLFLCVAILVLVVAPAFWWRGFLALPRSTSLLRVAGALAAFGVVSYAVLIPVFGLFGWLLVSTSPSSGEPESEKGIAIALIALWLPLWWAPSVGAFLTWLVFARQRGGTDSAA